MIHKTLTLSSFFNSDILGVLYITMGLLPTEDVELDCLFSIAVICIPSAIPAFNTDVSLKINNTAFVN